jgi:hypothetical protein
VRVKLQRHVDGDSQFVKILAPMPEDGIAAVPEACAEALEAGVANGDVVMAILARKRQPPVPPSITMPDAPPARSNVSMMIMRPPQHGHGREGVGGSRRGH